MLVSAGTGRDNGLHTPLWPKVFCDRCHEKGLTQRFKCRSCEDYDLCARCFKDATRVHAGHQFALWYPQTKLQGETTFTWSLVYCNVCNTKGLTERYKCQDCADFDLCGSCFKDVARHHPSHTVALLLPSSGDYAVPPHRPVIAKRNFWAWVNCGFCGRTGMSERFKCRTCVDYDLCQTCFLFRYAVHPNHGFNLLYPPASDVGSTERPLGSNEDQLGDSCTQLSCSSCGKGHLAEYLKCVSCSNHDYIVCEDCFQSIDNKHWHRDYALILPTLSSGMSKQPTSPIKGAFAHPPVPTALRIRGSLDRGSLDKAVPSPTSPSVPASNVSMAEKYERAIGQRPTFKEIAQTIMHRNRGRNSNGALHQFRRSEDARDRDHCCVCFNSARTMAFISCGHLALCGDCSDSHPTFCPICKTPNERGLVG
ncbi:hypothetical protein M427DRAFT_130350 [Gonapodya prolifera JEL478]|uniref:ZZ-type domain-containing protein n=1 Tax=Gonapodya prolifera (strain JEL478) TaxID=1344416 RepID=A0A139AXX1_GONPJ|nr:hypothetical protein M427DRAFT_130350 [Gonapodya prolifera JEL478]|eukprot:KXS21588.1 hypothetical protein M427DRAFT_130350 [Gonapodya prolifera JEL478]